MSEETYWFILKVLGVGLFILAAILIYLWRTGSSPLDDEDDYGC